MWENCGLSDTCANGFVCCAAKADLVGGKTTCRPSNDCGNTSWLAQCTKDDWMCGTDRKTLYQCTPSKMNMWVWAPKKECDSGFFCYDDGQYVGCRNW
ncbi:hypothetical protein HDU99_010868 [Rhizoclosmatium hyalinum]|nr:hypothetical protein HDU99_010868 [Rhizoclosmatium hyalinum]